MTASPADLTNQLAGAVEQAGAYTVRVNARGRLASSGVVWDAGVVLTADHTVEREDDITITLPDGSELPATIAGRDPRGDLAVLRVEGLTLAAAPRAGAVRVGNLAVAIGRPFGGDHGLGASLGIVSSVGGQRRGRRRHGTTIEGLIRPDLTMYPGFSGGPLVDTAGALIGINTSGFGGQPLTIPHEAAEAIVEQLLAHGRLRRGYLGMTSQPVRLPEKIATTAGQETGLLAIGIEEGSPAATGGLIIGDILIGVAGEPIRDTDDLRTALDGELASQPATLRILRGGELRELTVTIGER